MARMPDAVWAMTYSSSRRKHSHRCMCGRVIADGSPVLMARVMGNKTRAIHAACAATATFGGFTYGEHLEAQGYARLAAAGFPAAQRWMETAPINRPAARGDAR